MNLVKNLRPPHLRQTDDCGGFTPGRSERTGYQRTSWLEDVPKGGKIKGQDTLCPPTGSTASQGSSRGGLNLPRGALCRPQAAGQSETPKLYQTPRNMRMTPQQPTPVGSTLGSGLLPQVSLDPWVPLSVCIIRPQT